LREKTFSGGIRHFVNEVTYQPPQENISVCLTNYTTNLAAFAALRDDLQLLSDYLIERCGSRRGQTDGTVPYNPFVIDDDVSRKRLNAKRALNA
jgi:hypothetical protein